MKQRFIIIIICFAVVIMATAKVSYRTSELRRLGITLKIDTEKLHEGYNYLSVDGTYLTVRLQNNIIDHIGLNIFSKEMRQVSYSSVIDFLERYFLQLKYPPIEKTVAMMVRDDGFRFEKGTLQTVSELLPSDKFECHCDGHRYVTSWSRNENMILSVSFPVEYQLINGENKIEAESHILNDIQLTTIIHIPDNMEEQQNDFYIVKSCTNRIYFVGNRLVSGDRYPAETVANMMLSTEMEGCVQLHITQVEYGFKKSDVNVDLKQWISFCHNNKCQLYVGIDSISDKGSVDAVVLAVNQEENYNHVLVVTVSSDVIATQQGCIEACLYSYVPTHNIRNLFGLYQKSNPKTFVMK